MTTPTGIHIRFERSLNAPVEHVYKVLTEATHISKWYGPSDEFDVTVHTWEARVGGDYRVALKTPAGETHIVIGEFRELVPNEKVAYTWNWEGQPPMDTLVTFTIRPEGGQTALTLTHEGFPADDVRAQHEQGWTGSLERLSGAVR